MNANQCTDDRDDADTTFAIEIIVFVSSSIFVFILSAFFDLLERALIIIRQYEAWELDELFVTAIWGVVILSIFSYRRLRQTIDANKALDRQNKKLQAALEEIKTLKIILPICASCKKIRNEAGNWQNVEIYIHRHTGTDFSHSICPDCLRELYPEINLDA